MARNTSAWSIFLRGDNESFVATTLTFLATEKVVVISKPSPGECYETGVCAAPCKRAHVAKVICWVTSIATSIDTRHLTATGPSQIS